MKTIKATGRIALRLSDEDAAAVLTIARGLAQAGSTAGSSPFVTVSDVLRHALKVAAGTAGVLHGAARGQTSEALA
jgi:hypothetical protein